MSRKPYPTAPTNAYTQQTHGLYPTAPPQPQYPGNYPYQQPAPGHGAPPAGAPPPYQAAPPPYSQYPNQSQAAPAPPPQAMYYPQQPQPQTVMVPGVFDSGARFDNVAQPRLPPPPPGVAPNQAQLAAMQGHTIVGSQQGSSWLTGNSNHGGYNFGF